MSDELPGEVTTIDADTFDQYVTRNSLPVLVDFYADWCGPCKTMAPVISRLALAYRDELAVYKLNVDQAPVVARRLGIKAIPTLVLFSRGAVLGTLIGAHAMNSLQAFVDQHIRKHH